MSSRRFQPGGTEPLPEGLRERFRAAEELFHGALDEAPGARTAWIEAATPDVRLRALVHQLLAHHREAEPRPGVTGDDRGATGPGSASADGPVFGDAARIGPYALVRELGRGGMGVVFEAERADIGKRVALKVSTERFPSPERAERFDREQRVLGRLQHPHIAQLLDAGVTGDGVPYFVLELVDGVDVVRYADGADLDLAARIALFLDVCAAVEFAHRSLIVHRDLKPSNVLVTERGVVKLLDFGVAKLLEGTAAPDLTRTEARIFTPGYAAPEQLRGDPVTTATDLYQLGALLYQLLSGVPVFQTGDLTPLEMERQVLTSDPVPPSRRTESPPAAVGSIPPDVDSILLKALETDPGRRYGSVEALAADLRRFLASEPVSARPHTPAYRVARFVRRHRRGVAVGGAFIGLLLSAVAALVVEQRAAARQRDLAQAAALEAAREAETAEQVTTFLTGLFEASDPGVTLGDTLTARELLDRGVERLEALADQPSIQGRLLATIGGIHLRLGSADEAEELLERGLTVWSGVHDADGGAVAEARLTLGSALELQGRYDEASEVYRALAADSTVLAQPDLRSRTLYGLFTALHGLGATEPADSAFLAWEASLEDPIRPDVGYARALVRQGRTLFYRGEAERARAVLRRGVVQTRALYGDRHPALVAALLALVPALGGEDHAVELDATTREVVDLARRVYPEGHPELALALHERAGVLERSGDLGRAEALLREALAMETRSDGQDGIGWITRSRRLARVLVERGSLDEAEARFREARAWWRSNFGERYLFTVAVEADLASVLISRGGFDEAEAILLPAHAYLTADRGAKDSNTLVLTRLLAELYEAWGRPDDALPYRDLLPVGRP